MKHIDFPMKHIDFPMKHIDFPMKHIDFPMKHIDFPMKHIDFPMKHIDFPMKHIDFPMKHIDFPMKPSIFPWNQWFNDWLGLKPPIVPQETNPLRSRSVDLIWPRTSRPACSFWAQRLGLPWEDQRSFLEVSYGKIHHFWWENPLFLWQFSIAMLVYQRV